MKLLRIKKKYISMTLLLTIFCIIVGTLYFVLLRKPTFIYVTLKMGQESLMWGGEGVPNWYYHALSKGLIEKDMFGRPIVEVTDLFFYPINPAKKLAFVQLKINVVFSQNTKSYIYNGRPVWVGNSLRANPGNVLIEGLIMKISDSPDNDVSDMRTLIIDTQIFGNDASIPNTTGVFPFLADAVNINDAIKDGKGTTIIKVIDKKVESSKRILIPTNGPSYVSEDPYKKDVYLKLEIHATKEQDGYYIFDEIKIASGNFIPLQFENSVLYPTITKVNYQ